MLQDINCKSLVFFPQVLSPTYKSKTDDFKKTFKDIPNEERLIVGMWYSFFERGLLLKVWV